MTWVKFVFICRKDDSSDSEEEEWQDVRQRYKKPSVSRGTNTSPFSHKRLVLIITEKYVVLFFCCGSYPFTLLVKLIHHIILTRCIITEEDKIYPNSFCTFVNPLTTSNPHHFCQHHNHFFFHPFSLSSAAS